MIATHVNRFFSVNFRIRYLHVLKQNLAKCVVILTSELKLNNVTLRIL